MQSYQGTMATNIYGTLIHLMLTMKVNRKASFQDQETITM